MVPRRIPKHVAPVWVRNHLQLQLPFPPQLVTADEAQAIRDAVNLRKSASRRLLEIQQPRKFPVGWVRMAAEDPQWREKHYDRWTAKRKAEGLPHVIHERKTA